jgi:hypothetical protein
MCLNNDWSITVLDLIEPFLDVIFLLYMLLELLLFFDNYCFIDCFPSPYLSARLCLFDGLALLRPLLINFKGIWVSYFFSSFYGYCTILFSSFNYYLVFFSFYWLILSSSILFCLIIAWLFSSAIVLVCILFKSFELVSFINLKDSYLAVYPVISVLSLIHFVSINIGSWFIPLIDI